MSAVQNRHILPALRSTSAVSSDPTEQSILEEEVAGLEDPNAVVVAQSTAGSALVADHMRAVGRQVGRSCHSHV